MALIRYKRVLNELKNDSLKRSMVLSTLCKPVGMIISFFYTPMLLSYLGDESYGIWSTILSVINWINYFDVGIGQGLRNTLARSVALGDKDKSQKSVSTGYIALSVISMATYLVGILLIGLFDINKLFNTQLSVKPVLLVSFFCICINFVLSISKTQLYATQQAEKVGFMTVLTQGINLLGIGLLSLFSKENLLAVAIVIGLSGIIVNLIFTRKIWIRYNYLIPKTKQFRSSELKGICNVGIKFFFIQIAALILYSTDNMIITRLFGPSSVTPYHTSYVAFGMVNGLFGAMISPLWSKYTVAMEQKNFKWIKETVINLDKTLPFIGVALTVGSLLFDPVSRIWLHKTLTYDAGLVQCMALYYFLTIWGSIYANVLNGMSKVNLQLVLGVTSAILNIPLSVFLGRDCGMGTTGVCLATVICMLFTNVPVTISTHRLLNKMITESQG